MFKLVKISANAIYLDQEDGKIVMKEFVITSDFDIKIDYDSILKERIFYPLIILN